MGCNFYLKKKNGEDWVLPKNRVGEMFERLLVKQSSCNDTITIALSDCLTHVDRLHIGKSSYGWHFGLCIYPYLEIYSLEDWRALFESDEYEIVSEEDGVISCDDMISRITKRRQTLLDAYGSLEEYEQASLNNSNNFATHFSGKQYDTYEELMAANHATRGLNGLWAHESSIWDMRSDERWSGFMPMMSTYIRTDGTYDLTPEYDFS